MLETVGTHADERVKESIARLKQYLGELPCSIKSGACHFAALSRLSLQACWTTRYSFYGYGPSGGHFAYADHPRGTEKALKLQFQLG
jgi:hypothetical protein